LPCFWRFFGCKINARSTEKSEERRAELIEAIRNGSVATWKHFNLHGEFDFSDERMVDSMGLAVPKNPDWKAD